MAGTRGQQGGGVGEQERRHGQQGSRRGRPWSPQPWPWQARGPGGCGAGCTGPSDEEGERGGLSLVRCLVRSLAHLRKGREGIRRDKVGEGDSHRNL